MGNGMPFSDNARVDQAQGMVAVQAHCTVDEALALMKDRAAVQHQALDEIADDVVDRAIRFAD